MGKARTMLTTAMALSLFLVQVAPSKGGVPSKNGRRERPASTMVSRNTVKKAGAIVKRAYHRIRTTASSLGDRLRSMFNRVKKIFGSTSSRVRKVAGRIQRAFLSIRRVSRKLRKSFSRRNPRALAGKETPVKGNQACKANC